MTFCRSRLKVDLRKLQYFDWGAHKVSQGSRNFGGGQFVKPDVPVHYLWENSMDRFIIRSTTNDIEVPYESLRHLNLIWNIWLHCSWKNQVFYWAQSKVLVFNIVPLSVIHPLAEQLNRRLATRFVISGHVQIIQENVQFLSMSWSQLFATLLLQLAFNVFL